MGGTRKSERLDQLIEDAETAKRCIVGASENDATCLRRAVAAGKLISPFPRLYVRLKYWEKLKRPEQGLHMLRGLQHLHPDWVFAGVSAALAHGLSVSYSVLTPVCVATSYKTHSRNQKGVFRIVVEDEEITTVSGVRATTLEQTVFDCLRILDFPLGLAVADSALRVAHKSRDWLIDKLMGMPQGCKGRDHALATAMMADARAGSGGESIARARMLLLGYEPPDLQVKVQNKVEGGNYYGDFGWRMPDGTLLIGELDGHDKYTDPEMTDGKSVLEVMADERLRESRVSAGQVTVMRFSYKDMTKDARFRLILDTYGVPRATCQHYHDKGKRFVPSLEGTAF